MGRGPARAEALRMTTKRSTHTAPTNHNIAARMGRWSVQHRRKAILGWLTFVFAALVIGFNVVPQKELEQNTGMPGESGKAGEVMNDAFPKKSGEQVLIHSRTLKASDSQFKDAVADVSKRLEGTQRVSGVAAAEVSEDGHSALVTFDLDGDQEATKKSVVDSQAAV